MPTFCVFCRYWERCGFSLVGTAYILGQQWQTHLGGGLYKFVQDCISGHNYSSSSLLHIVEKCLYSLYAFDPVCEFTRFLFSAVNCTGYLPEVRRMSRIEGLKADSSHFTLERKPFRILGGSIHYFRVPRAYWEDRLLKMKACGINTLTT